MLIYDAGHLENFGDRMVHEVVSAALGSRVPQLEVVRMTGVSIHPVPGYFQLHKHDWVEIGNECDLVLVLGGSVFFNDRMLALNLTRLDELEVPLVIWGGVQDPDWLQTVEGRERVSRLAAGATRVFHRFPGEVEVLRGLIPKEKLTLGGYPCLLMPAAYPKQEGRLVLALSRHLIERFPEVAAELPAICRELGEQYELLAVWCETDDAAHFEDLLPGAYSLFGYDHMLSVLRNCEGVVGCRLHPLVVGAAQGVPIVGWEIGSQKVRWLMEAIGAEGELVDVAVNGLSGTSLVDFLRASSDRQTEHRQRAESLARAAQETLDWVADGLEEPTILLSEQRHLRGLSSEV